MDPQTVRDGNQLNALVAEDADPQNGSANPTSYVDRLKKQNEEKHEVRDLNKEMLQQQTDALLGTVREAIGKIQNENAAHPSAAFAWQMAELQSLEQNAESILSALKTHGESVSGLGKREASISSKLALIEDGPEAERANEEAAKEKERQQNAALKLQMEEEDKIEMRKITAYDNDNMFMHSLSRHRQAFGTMLEENANLDTQATDQVATGKADLLATVALAALLYEGYRNQDALTGEKVTDFLKAKKETMLEAVGPNATAADVDAIEARIQTIAQQAQHIHTGMLESHEEGGKRLLAAANAFMAQPLDEHMKQSDAHFQKTLAHLDMRVRNHMGNTPTKPLDSYHGKVVEWAALSDKTSAQHASLVHEAQTNLKGVAFKSDSGKELTGEELYAAVADTIGLHKMTKNFDKYADRNKDLLKEQADILHTVKHETHLAQDALAKVLTGEGKAHDIEMASTALGIAPMHMRFEMLKSKIMNNQHDEELHKAFVQDAGRVQRAMETQRTSNYT